jgi:hypothetical protein
LKCDDVGLIAKEVLPEEPAALQDLAVRRIAGDPLRTNIE